MLNKKSNVTIVAGEVFETRMNIVRGLRGISISAAPA